MKSAITALATATLTGAMLATSSAYGSHASNAVDVCQGSLPSFEGALRKRPLAIANEGTSSSFVSCSLQVPIGPEDMVGVLTLFSNRSASNQIVSCTLVDGIALPYPNNAPAYQPKAVLIEDGEYGILQWTAGGDNGGDPYDLPNLNCSLPAGVEINFVQLNTELPV
jgi:hypothetical protein